MPNPTVVEHVYPLGAGVQNTLTITPAAGDVIYAVFYHNRSTPRDVVTGPGSALGATWTALTPTTGQRLYVWKGVGATSAGTVSLTFSGSIVGGGLALINIRGLANQGIVTAVSEVFAGGNVTGPSQNAGDGQVIVGMGIGANPTVLSTLAGTYTQQPNASGFIDNAYAIPSGAPSAHQLFMTTAGAGLNGIAQVLIGSYVPSGVDATVTVPAPATATADAPAPASPSSDATVEAPAATATAGAGEAGAPIELSYGEYWDNVRLVVGSLEDPIDLINEAAEIKVRRGLTPVKAVNELDPGWLAARILDPLVNPEDNPETRPGKPIWVLVRILEGPEASWEPVFTGTISRARIVFGARDDADEIEVLIEAEDAIAALAAHPHKTARTGNLHQRVRDVLDALDIASGIIDSQPNQTGRTSLPTDETYALDQLRLIRNTMHALMHVDRYGVFRATADRDRPDTSDPVVTFSDVPVAGDPETVILYTHLEPDWDTDDLVNVQAVELAGSVEGPVTVTDAASVTAWGPHAGETIKVNEGDPASHAARYIGGRDTPGLIVKRIQFNATERVSQAALLEINDPVLVDRAGMFAGAVFQIIALEHTLTARRWITSVETRTLESLPIRWDDLPADLTWDDLPADLTWDDLAVWTP